ncbi:hypothetical protein AHMF7605_26075 [Adhaeribacter arboris]|uniref:Class I SAM-dependent methyltransferase n=1 Tax=Adhaeribacter arboris TaxID=2072846 RepID=A0A2T2YMI1_9BACT|nr:hypothetical protein [Adhaeribacter arboris]PSR56713.1 hypothetical protein AHMF7605_26075 [Adhaeribacter arboris]
MGRIHLFEWEDQPWFPAFLRNYGTDFLQFLANKTRMYQPILPILARGLTKSKTNQILDLGSGGGGGLIWLNSELKKQVPDLQITLTDFYPNLPAFERTQRQAANFAFIEQAVDARKVPADLPGLRTQFLSLHHFKPGDALQILQNAVDANRSIAVFEAQERSIISIVAMLLSPMSVWLTTPFIRPFNIGRLIFTYLIPLVPLFVLWDGVVSALRTYSLAEMKQLVANVKGKENYDWEINKLKSGPSVILYLLGTKK